MFVLKYCIEFIFIAGDLVAIYNAGLKIAEDAAFTAPVTVIDDDGCVQTVHNNVAKTVFIYY